MAFSETVISNYPNNKYSAVMKESAEVLSFGSPMLLLPFLFYHIIGNDAASLIVIQPMIKALWVIIIGEIVFVIASKLAHNVVLAAMNTLLVTPLVIRNQIEMAQNIQNTILAIFGLFLCVAAWFFAGYAVNYAYSSPPFTS